MAFNRFMGVLLATLLNVSTARGEAHALLQNTKDPFCSAISQFHKGFNDDFEKLKGTFYDAGQDLKVWNSKILLPGAKRCDIWQTDTGKYVACEIAAPGEHPEHEKIFNNTLALLKSCLTDQWKTGIEVSVTDNPHRWKRFHADNDTDPALLQLHLKSSDEKKTGSSVELEISQKPASAE